MVGNKLVVNATELPLCVPMQSVAKSGPKYGASRTNTFRDGENLVPLIRVTYILFHTDRASPPATVAYTEVKFEALLEFVLLAVAPVDPNLRFCVAAGVP